MGSPSEHARNLVGAEQDCVHLLVRGRKRPSEGSQLQAKLTPEPEKPRKARARIIRGQRKTDNENACKSKDGVFRGRICFKLPLHMGDREAISF